VHRWQVLCSGFGRAPRFEARWSGYAADHYCRWLARVACWEAHPAGVEPALAAQTADPAASLPPTAPGPWAGSAPVDSTAAPAAMIPAVYPLAPAAVPPAARWAWGATATAAPVPSWAASAAPRAFATARRSAPARGPPRESPAASTSVELDWLEPRAPA